MVELRLAGQHLSRLWVFVLFAPDSTKDVELLPNAARHGAEPEHNGGV